MIDVESASSPVSNHIKASLARAPDAAQCLALASAAEEAGDAGLTRACLERAIGLDRHCQAALLNLAALSLDEQDSISTFGLLEEAARVSPLPADIEPLREQLFTAVRQVPQLDRYLQAVGRTPMPVAETRLSVVVVTSVFPSNAPAGSACPIEELVNGLIARGHQVRVLTGEAPSAADQPAAVDGAVAASVLRKLRVLGTRSSADEQRQILRDNTARVRTAVAKSSATLVLVGDMETLDLAILRPALDAGVPVVHWLGRGQPSFAVDTQPRDSNYALVPMSEAIGDGLREAGYGIGRVAALCSGVRLSRCFRLMLPDTGRLRICAVGWNERASDVETLLNALARLQREGLDFEAEIASGTADETWVRELQSLLSARGLERAVRLSRARTQRELSALFARHNVFVFHGSTRASSDLMQVEALAAGLVVITDGTAGADEIVQDQTSGLRFAAGDERDLADKLGRLARDSELMSRLQRQGQARAMTFSVEHTVKKLEKLAAEMSAPVEALW